MKRENMLATCILVCIMAAGVFAVRPSVSTAQDLTIEEMKKHKNLFDDPRPVLQEFSYKKVLPPGVYAKLVYDPEAMKKAWAEAVGFTAPDVVGKIAPDIQPGAYSYQDKEKFKELMIPTQYDAFKPGGSPLAGNFPQIKVIPTRQYYWALPIAEATKKSTAKLDAQGYLVPSSYAAGYPFPKPDGPLKAQQVMANWLVRYVQGESAYTIQESRGWNNLREDYNDACSTWYLRLGGRTTIPPLGWFDEGAQKMGEVRVISRLWLAPRENFGNFITVYSYLDTNRDDHYLSYLGMVRIGGLSSFSATNDKVPYNDMIYEDIDGFNQKMSPTIYPMKYEVVAEREYLVPAPTLDGARFMASKSLELQNMEFERRPLYVIQLTELDNRHPYSKRILYIDRETFFLYYVEAFDRQGKLYRSMMLFPSFIPEMGLIMRTGQLNRGYQDNHSFYTQQYSIPKPDVGRKQFNMTAMQRVK
jgi:hypothetical protein